jgi:predicted nucleic acid-binding Zn ribbon protein
MVWLKKKKQKVVAAVLPGIMRERGWEKQLDLHSIFPRWVDLVDAEVSDHALPLKIVRGTLWLEVENSSWLQDLQYRKMELLDTLNQSLRLSRLNDIKMVLPVGRKKGRKVPDRSVRFVKPDEEKIAAFEQQVSCIADEQCRDALMQFWYLSHACKIKESK